MLNIIRLLFFVFIFTSCKEKIEFDTPKALGDLVFEKRFDNIKSTEQNFLINKKIHDESLCLNAKDSTIAIFNKPLQLNKKASISLWIKPEFYGVNGTIITLSKEKKDFPINSVLSIYMNKNRIAVMQNGKDLRKTNYNINNSFTKEFMALEELEVGELFFLTYSFKDNKVSIYIDSNLYVEYTNVPDLEQSNFITIGAAWNQKGTKYHFRGCVDDIYIYENSLEETQLQELMKYTHLYYELNR